MSTVQFQYLKDPMTGEQSKTSVLYTDESGTIWTVPLGTGHRFEDLFNAWKGAGNSVLPAV